MIAFSKRFRCSLFVFYTSSSCMYSFNALPRVVDGVYWPKSRRNAFTHQYRESVTLFFILYIYVHILFICFFFFYVSTAHPGSRLMVSVTFITRTFLGEALRTRTFIMHVWATRGRRAVIFIGRKSWLSRFGMDLRVYGINEPSDQYGTRLYSVTRTGRCIYIIIVSSHQIPALNSSLADLYTAKTILQYIMLLLLYTEIIIVRR